MAEYKSNAVVLQGNAEQVYDKLSDLGALKTLLDTLPTDNIPEDKREMFSSIVVTEDSITIPTGQGPIPELTLRREGCERPSLVRLAGEGMPVPLFLSLALNPVDAESCEGVVTVDVGVPAMLKPMIAGPMNKLISQISSFLPQLDFRH